MDIFNLNELRDGDRVEVEVNGRDGTDPYRVIGTYSKYGDSVAGFIPLRPASDITVKFIQAWRSTPAEPTGLGAVVRAEYPGGATGDTFVRVSNGDGDGYPWAYTRNPSSLRRSWASLAAGLDVASLTVLSAGFEGDL